MRSIEFIAPVESMRGNLSGKQDLVYNDHDNKAFEAPVGRQYAKNYQPRFIGAKRASDNRKYFAVKTKSATRISNVTKLNMALLGASAVIYNGINRLEQYGTTEQKVNIDIIRQEYNSFIGVTFEAGTSWKQFLMDRIRVMLASHAQFAEFGTTLKTKVLNPYYVGIAPTPASENLVVDIPQQILVKFWAELGVDGNGDTPCTFTVNGLVGIGFTNGTFNQIIENDDPRFNVLNLLKSEISAGNDYVCMGIDGQFVILGSTYQEMQSSIVANAKYTTTTVAPE